MSVNRIDTTLTDDQRDRANAALLADQYAKLHRVATGALEDSLDQQGKGVSTEWH